MGFSLTEVRNAAMNVEGAQTTSWWAKDAHTICKAWPSRLVEVTATRTMRRCRQQLRARSGADCRGCQGANGVLFTLSAAITVTVAHVCDRHVPASALWTPHVKKRYNYSLFRDCIHQDMQFYSRLRVYVNVTTAVLCTQDRKMDGQGWKRQLMQVSSSKTK